MVNASPGQSDEEFPRILRTHFEDWVKENAPNFDELSEDTSTETLAEVFKALEKLADTEFQGITQGATAEFIDAIEATFREWARTACEELDPDGASGDRPIYNTLVRFFEADEWPFVDDDDDSILYLNFQGENGQWPCLTKVREEEEQVVFYSIYPEAVPEAKRLAMAEFITRANYDMVIGNFELDYSDGEVRYKTSIDVEGSILNSALIEQLVYTNVLTMDQYLPGILAVIEGGVEPRVAVERMERDGGLKGEF